jgi:hypothetical protein
MIGGGEDSATLPSLLRADGMSSAAAVLESARWLTLLPELAGHQCLVREFDAFMAKIDRVGWGRRANITELIPPAENAAAG